MRGKVAGREAIKTSIFTLVLLRETRSRRCGKASSHLQDTRVATACKGKMRRSRNIFCLADRTVVLRVRPSCIPRLLLPDFPHAPSICWPVVHFAVCFFTLSTVQGVILNAALFSFFSSLRSSGTRAAHARTTTCSSRHHH